MLASTSPKAAMARFLLWLLFLLATSMAESSPRRSLPTTSVHKISSRTPTEDTSSHHDQPLRRTAKATPIIISSVLGGTVLLLIALAVFLCPIWCRRQYCPKYGSGTLMPSCAIPDRPSKRPTTRRPTTSRATTTKTVRPVTPSPRRLAIDATVAPIRRWELEKGTCVHTPSGHPATIVWRGNSVFSSSIKLQPTVENEHGNEATAANDDGSERRDDAEENIVVYQHEPDETVALPRREHDPQLEQSISSTFAAEMSGLLESISIKSSYSSLRSGGGTGLSMPRRRPMESEGGKWCVVAESSLGVGAGEVAAKELRPASTQSLAVSLE